MAEIGAALQATASGVASAGRAADAAGATADSVVGEASARGFAGVAEAMRPVTEAIGEAQILVGSVDETLRQALAQIEALPPQPSPGQLIGALGVLGQMVSTVAGGITASIAKIDEAASAAAAALDGGQPGDLLAMLDAVREVLNGALEQGATTGDKIDATVTAAQALGKA